MTRVSNSAFLLFGSSFILDQIRNPGDDRELLTTTYLRQDFPFFVVGWKDRGRGCRHFWPNQRQWFLVALLHLPLAPHVLGGVLILLWALRKFLHASRADKVSAKDALKSYLLSRPKYK